MLKMQLVDVLPGGACKEIHVDTHPTAVARLVFTCCLIPIFLPSLIKVAASAFQQIGLQVDLEQLEHLRSEIPPPPHDYPY